MELAGVGYNWGKLAKNCMKITKKAYLGQNSGGTWVGQANFLGSGIRGNLVFSNSYNPERVIFREKDCREKKRLQCHHQPVKNDMRTYEGIQTIIAGQGDDSTSACLLDYTFFKNWY